MASSEMDSDGFWGSPGASVPQPPLTGTRMDKLPPRGLLRAAQAMCHGMKYERAQPDQWRSVCAEDHLNRARRHICLYQMGDTSEDHVGHAVARLLMWADRLSEEEKA